MANRLTDKDINVLYFDFGNHIENNILRKICFNSWKKWLPNANYICINEENEEFKKFIKECKFTKESIKSNCLAFLADSCRLYLTSAYDNLLYLDTDVYIRTDIMDLLNKNNELCGCQLNNGIVLPQNGTFLWTRNKTDKFNPIVEFYHNRSFNNDEYNIVVNEKFKNLFNVLVNDTIYFNHLHLSMYEKFKKIIPIIEEDSKSIPLLPIVRKAIQFVYLFVTKGVQYDNIFEADLKVCDEFFDDLCNYDSDIIIKDFI